MVMCISVSFDNQFLYLLVELEHFYIVSYYYLVLINVMEIVDLPQIQFIIQNEIAAVQFIDDSFAYILQFLVLFSILVDDIFRNVESVELLAIVRHYSVIVVFAIQDVFFSFFSFVYVVHYFLEIMYTLCRCLLVDCQF